MIYLNYAALCPTLPEAEEEVERTLAEFKRYLYSEAGIEWYLHKIRDCRHKVGDLLHVDDPATIAFTTNASTAHYLALASLKWESGDTILTTTHENPSIAGQLQALKRDGVHVHAVRPVSPEQFLTALHEHCNRSNVKAVVMSHVSHVDGRVFPVHEAASLARAGGCLVIIDGAQAIGQIPVDLNALDFDGYFFPGHKWCEGPLGTGALVVREGMCTHPRSRTIEEAQHGRPTASQFEIGTQNIGLIAGLARACEQRQRQNLTTEQQPAFRETVKDLLGGASHCHVMEWQGPHAPCILTFQGTADLDHGRFATRLASEFGIVVKPFVEYPEGDAPAIRLSWSPTMNQQDVLQSVSKMASLLEA